MSNYPHPLTAYREAHGLSRSELAVRLEVSEATIWRWEHWQREPRGNRRRRISAVTGISPTRLIAPEIEAAE